MSVEYGGICSAGIRSPEVVAQDRAGFCPTCGSVTHQPIPEDEAHCYCLNGKSWWADGPWIHERPCTCACHVKGGAA